MYGGPHSIYGRYARVTPTSSLVFSPLSPLLSPPALGVCMTACQKKSQKSGFEPAKMDICNISTNSLNLKVKLVANETGEGKKGAEKKEKRKGKIIVY